MRLPRGVRSRYPANADPNIGAPGWSTRSLSCSANCRASAEREPPTSVSAVGLPLVERSGTERRVDGCSGCPAPPESPPPPGRRHPPAMSCGGRRPPSSAAPSRGRPASPSGGERSTTGRSILAAHMRRPPAADAPAPSAGAPGHPPPPETAVRHSRRPVVTGRQVRRTGPAHLPCASGRPPSSVRGAAAASARA
jgi:hypothetical protein